MGYGLMKYFLSVDWWQGRDPLTKGAVSNPFDRPIALLTMIFTGIAGVAVAGLNPIIASAYVEHLGFSESAAGYMLAVDMVGFTIGTLFVSSHIHLWDRRRTAVTGLLVLLCGNLFCFMTIQFQSLLVLRFLVGLGAGGVAGVMAASLAASSRPDRIFAVYTVLVLTTTGILMIATPRLLGGFGIRGLFSLLAFMTVPALCLVRNFPAFAGDTGTGTPAASDTGSSLPLRVVVIVGLATFAYYLGTAVVWPFIAQMGKSRGFDLAGTGNLLALSQVFGVAGAMVPMLLGTRLGRALPIGFALVVSSCCLLALLLMEGKMVYAIVVQVYSFVWLLFFPYLMGIVSNLDPLGRLAGVSYAVQSIGFAIGPALAATLITGGGYTALYYLGMGCYLVTAVLLLPVAVGRGISP